MASSAHHHSWKFSNSPGTLAAIIESSPVSMLLVEESGRIILANHEAKRTFEYTADEFSELRVDSLMPKRYRHAHVNSLEKYFAAPASRPMGRGRTLFGVRKDGSEFPIEVGLASVRTPWGSAVIATVLDLSYAAEREDRLRKLSRAVEQSPAAVMITDADGTIEYVNPKFVDLTGYEAKEVIGESPRLLSSGNLPDDVYREMWKTLRAGNEWTGEFSNKKKTGELYWEAASISPMRDAAGVVNSFVAVKEDITDRKRREETVRRDLDFAKHVIAVVPQPLVVLDCELKIISVNRAFEELFQLTGQDLQGAPLFDVAGGAWNTPELRKKLPWLLGKCLTLEGLELRGFFEGVGERVLEVSAHKLQHPGSEDECIIVAFDDVTEQRSREDQHKRQRRQQSALIQTQTNRLNRSREDLRKNEAHLFQMLELLPLGVFVLDGEGRTHYANKQAIHLLGKDISATDGGEPLSEAYALYVSGTNDLYPDDKLPVTKALGGIYTTIADIEIRRPDKTVPLIVSGGPVFDDDGRVVFALAVFQDFSEQRRLQAQFLQSQKMDAVGRLASGVAHDFNNLLTAILSFSEFVIEDLDPAAPSHADMNEILKAASRGEGLTRQLLAFSRRQTIQPRILNVNEQVRSIEAMLRRLLGEHIEISVSLQRDLWNTVIDPGAFEQVMLNMAVNARDAMRSGGRLTISTKNVTLEQQDDLSPTEPSGATEWACVTITDNGLGMDEELQSHIFEPFFTTKDKEHGTGLGLSTCYGIVTQAGGTIVVSSTLGHGTTFEIRLPRTLRKVCEAAHMDANSTTQTAGGGQTILLAEDDEQVRSVAVRALSDRGYNVVAAVDGEDALRLCREHAGSIDLLVTDVVMPKMAGSRLAGEVTTLCPGIPVLYVSGYTEAVVASHGLLKPGVTLLQKPFTVEQLARAVGGSFGHKPLSAPEV